MLYNGPFANVDDVNDLINHGERYLPLITPYNAAMHLGHMASYRHALRYAYGKKVLDVGCGVGYGSHFLAFFGAQDVTGMDIDPQVIDYASRNYNHPALHFVLSYKNKPFPFEDQTFDFIFCSQVIENLEDPLLFLKEIRRVLKMGGFCLITSPNKELFSPDPFLTPNRYHINEMSYSELSGLGKRVFSHVKVAGIPQNCLIQHADKTVTVKTNEELNPEDFSMRSDNVSVCENLLMFAHTRPNGKFDTSLPASHNHAAECLLPMFWDSSVNRWIILGAYPKNSVTPGVKVENKIAYGAVKAPFVSPYDNLYRVDIALLNAGEFNIDVTLRDNSPEGRILFHAEVTRTGRKLSLLFPPFQGAANKTYWIELQAHCEFLDKIINRKILPHFELKNGALPLWTFHQELKV